MLVLYFALVLFSLCPCDASQEAVDICGLSYTWFNSVDISATVSKKGFHRELLYKVRHVPTPHFLKALLIQRMPKGVYMDQYELASMREDTGLQVFLDSSVHLEDPSYMSTCFTALIYLSPANGHPGLLEAVVPFHGRYHRPSDSGGWEIVTIKQPKLLLFPESCEKLTPSEPHHIVKAPCTVHNQSLCSWLEIKGLQDPYLVTLQIPVGNFSLTLLVCAGTMLTSLLCCALLFRIIWTHGITRNSGRQPKNVRFS
ncbi:phosphatidylinositol-glycan biosynthesis class X protein isoform X2 [Hoplias malabaricus]|uniref:phosphatidylinositol-glycan biosynthesis class X protein isoform X2 n=1 Tax=Hoplias malabaricus TaxID=27720 RepID=UPI0034620315